MGLAAGQARLLTITGRKSDCEFESMGLSHQKIALARDLADLSNEYQNSMNQTKLFYDYYGTGDMNNQLSYNILMQPSALNNYKPTTITDSLGRVVLSSRLAQAARAAGIPQEGLGTLPSDLMRNNFVQQLASEGLITQTKANTIMSIPYNQQIGFGGGVTVAAVTNQVTLDELLEKLDEYSLNLNGDVLGALLDNFNYELGLYESDDNCSDGFINLSFFKDNNPAEEEYIGDHYNVSYYADPNSSTYQYERNSYSSLTLKDLLSDEGSLVIYGMSGDNNWMGGVEGDRDHALGQTYGSTYRWTWRYYIQDSVIWDVLAQAASDLFDLGDGYTQKALEYAKTKLDTLLDVNRNTDDKNGWNMGYYYDENGGISHEESTLIPKTKGLALDFIGPVQIYNNKDTHNDTFGINLSTLARAYLTYFADYINGVSKTDVYGIDKYHVTETITDLLTTRASTGNQICNSRFVTDDDDFVYTVKVGTDVSSDDLGQATFYDALFNQICKNGWTENDNVRNNEYLQQMLQSGMMFLSRMRDDGYYYQGNYATDTYIKEVADESFIAAAEAKYTTEKAKLNAKEQTIDMKMKNLDTEISALTTEYDSVKSTIAKQIEKSFKRYSA